MSGDDANRLAVFAWFNENSAGMTHPVAALKSNDFGLFDMNGNVAEWCWDGYAPYQDNDVANPQGPAEVRERVIRGGSWSIDLHDCRPARRGRKLWTTRDERQGFRIAKN